METIKAFFAKYWHFGLALLVLVLVVYLIYRAGKKSNQVNIVSDTGGAPTPDQIAKAKSLAEQLHADLTGANTFGHTDSIYNDLNIQSDVVFALTFGYYKSQFGTSLVEDLNDDNFWGWDVTDNILTRATKLNLT